MRPTPALARIVKVGHAAFTKNSDYSPNSPSQTQQASTGNFVLPVDLSYELDLWSRVRRTVAAAREETQATAADYVLLGGVPHSTCQRHGKEPNHADHALFVWVGRLS